MSCNAIDLKQKQIRKLIGYVKAKKYRLYTRPNELNIISVRNADTKPEKFDDLMNVFWKNADNKWVGKQYNITTDPSTNYLEKGGIGTFEGKKATAILPAGQYIDTWAIGSHRGNYTALTQAKEACVYRDYDRNAYLDFDVKDMNCGKFGMNIHRAKTGGADDGQGNTKKIGPYSAGCQVFQNYYCFLEFLEMCKIQRDLYGNKFTYTLIDKWLERQFYIKRFILGSGIITGSALLAYGISLWLKNK